MITYESILELWSMLAEGAVTWGMVARARSHWGQFMAAALAHLVAMGVEIAAVAAMCESRTCNDHG